MDQAFPANTQRVCPDSTGKRIAVSDDSSVTAMFETITLDHESATPTRTIRVLLVDDHPLVRKGLAILINEEPGMEICGEAQDETRARELAISVRPHVAIVDWSLGQRDASGLLAFFHDSCPETTVLVLSMHDEVSHVERALRLGARGYVMKRDASDRILEAVRRSNDGFYAFTDRATAALPVDLKTLIGSGNFDAPRNPAHRLSQPPGARADLVIAPHPDDETFGCGGTIRLVAETGTAVDVVFMTRGELGHEAGESISPAQQAILAEQRVGEAKEACSALGVRRITFLDGNDTRLREQPHLARDLLTLLSGTPYRRVFCPWKLDGHRDHQATFAHLQTALRAYPESVQIWLYEVWTPLGFNVLIPIDRTIAHKRKAMQTYRTQLPQVNYQGSFLGLSAYRSAFCPPANFAEAFYMCSKEELLTL
jgi:N-acetylglucosamine malate deacetylase 1